MYTVRMSELRFEWDPVKADVNLRKHGVRFDEARTVFYDESALQFFDPDHSDDEERFLMLGLSLAPRLLVVCHCFRENDVTIRIVSARRANRAEAKVYWSRRR